MAKKKKRPLIGNLNKLRRRADKVERAATRQHQNFFSGRVGVVKEIRFSIGIWLGLVILLILILVLQSFLYRFNNGEINSSPGGAYAEGVVGEITSFNPLYAETNDEKALSSLVYSSLFKTDETNNISLDLASNWKISEDGLNYDIQLRDDALWHNSDKPVTVDDVVFTVKLLKNSKVQSPLYGTWKNIEVLKVSDSKVRFTLRTPLASFPWALNFGILSSDELKDIEREELREYLSDHVAIGSGPFAFRNVSQSGSKNKILYFAPNDKYFDGAPQVESLHIETYSDSQELVQGFKNGEVNLANSISLESARENVGTNLHSTPTDSGVFAIFNLDETVTSSSTVRKALRLGLNRDNVRQAVSVGEHIPNKLETPIAPGIFNKVDALRQPVDNVSEAKRLLKSDGWQYNNESKLVKNLKPMKLNIVTVRDSDYVPVAEEIAKQWNEIGVDTEIILASAENIQQNFIMPRNYDVLVYRLELGGDGDVYSYWNSAGIKEQGLNLANYNSATADMTLARARTQLDSATRGATYKDFVETWLSDVPAIALYQADLYYLKTDNVQAWRGDSLIDESVRFRNVNGFTVNVAEVNKTP